MNAVLPSHSRDELSLDRRDFLKLLGASLALAGIQGCTTRQPKETILPYVNPPQGSITGKPQYYATAMERSGSAIGLLVKSDQGRPTKVDGNPLHPASLGSTDIFCQASLLTLYDPARSACVIHQGAPSTWEAYCGEMSELGKTWQGNAGKGLRVLTGPFSSPSFSSSLQNFLQACPEAKLHTHDPLDSGNAAEGIRTAFARPLAPVHHFDLARVVVSLDADFLGFGAGQTRYSHDFALGRRPESSEGMNRLYVAEPCPSITGAMADARLPLSPFEIETLAIQLAENLGLPDLDKLNVAFSLPQPAGYPDSLGETSAAGTANKQWIKNAAADLLRNHGRGIILAGESLPAWIHGLVCVLNDSLGNLGNTVTYIEPPQGSETLPHQSLADLVKAMNAGEVSSLLILESNPAYTSPSDLDFLSVISKVPNTIHAGLYRNETGAACRWHLPTAHYLEAWDDARAFDGTATIVQPIIAPLFGGKTKLQILGSLLGDFNRDGYSEVRAYWEARFRAGMDKAASASETGGFEAFWNRSLAQGNIADTAYPVRQVRPVSDWPPRLSESAAAGGASAGNRSRNGSVNPVSNVSLAIAFRPDPMIGDGAFSENAWLQELPKPLTQLTWDNAAYLSPGTAVRLGIKSRDELELVYRGRALLAPAWIIPGHAEDVVTLTLGYGRRTAHPAAHGFGYDAYGLRSSDRPWQDGGLSLRKTGKAWTLAATQDHHAMEGRNPVVTSAYYDFKMVKEPPEPRKERTSLYPDFPYEGYAWGMAIDLSLCTGCSACVIACQAENNIPVVGKDQVARGREMHWIRLANYFQGSAENPAIFFQPIPCMHCENAPCELVCPVEATVHDSEGLNAMVYNRCIGTRYCSNNCPYKVRRFNFLQYSDMRTEILNLVRNPDVTVRSRGVMEKCTYCVQRIERARIDSEIENRKIRDGEAVTACAQACPTGAIVFGDTNDGNSRVALHKRSRRNYALLEELNTRPRTTYLSRVSNPPEMILDEEARATA